MKDPELLSENHGGWYYEMKELGYNFRLTDIQAALGISQLKKASDNLNKRIKISQRYIEAFQGTEIKFQKSPERFFNAYHLFVIQHPERDTLYNYLKDHKIFAQVHYIPVHLHPFYQNLGWKKGDFPNTENLYDSCLSLPMYPSLTSEQLEFVIGKVLEFTG